MCSFPCNYPVIFFAFLLFLSTFGNTQVTNQDPKTSTDSNDGKKTWYYSGSQLVLDRVCLTLCSTWGGLVKN